LRLSKGISQEELAEKARLDRTYVSSVERGHRNIGIDNIEKLAEALSVEAWELMRRN
jgi:transcriptional regulator with XRE-family HTH domain